MKSTDGKNIFFEYQKDGRKYTPNQIQGGRQKNKKEKPNRLTKEKTTHTRCVPRRRFVEEATTVTKTRGGDQPRTEIYGRSHQGGARRHADEVARGFLKTCVVSVARN